MAKRSSCGAKGRCGPKKKSTKKKTTKKKTAKRKKKR